MDILLVLAGIENYGQLLEDYRYIVENFSNHKPLSDILEVLGNNDDDSIGGFDTTTDGSCRKCYTFESLGDGRAKYMGLWKC